MGTAEAPLGRDCSGRWKEINSMKDRISNPRWLDKARAAFRRECGRGPFLPPLLSVAGKVELNGAIRVVLPTIGGNAVVTASPVGGWRFKLTDLESDGAAPADVEVAAAQAAVPPAATVVDQPHYDALFDLLIDLERRVLAEHRVLADLKRQMSALEAKQLHDDVVHLNNVAAE
jgi:hypothetical protein